MTHRRSTFAVAAATLVLTAFLLTGCTASPPGGLTVTAGDGSARATFTRLGPDFDYEVRAMPGNHVSWTDQSSAVVTGLENGTEYTLYVRARGIAGNWGEWSEGSAPVTPRGRPAAPTISQVSGFVDLATGCTVRVAFTPGANGGQPITGYEVTVSGGAAPVRGTTSPIEVSGLTPHQTYDITVRAINASGAGPASATFTGPCS